MPNDDTPHDPNDIDLPPYFFGHDIVPGKRIILLIAGIQPQPLVIRRTPGGNLETVPADLIPTADFQAAQKQNNIVKQGLDEMSEGWEALTKKYSSPDFKNDGWELVRLWATNSTQLVSAIQGIGKKKPLGLAVHYVGHGNDRKNNTKQHPDGMPWDEPLLTVEPLKSSYLTYTFDNGAKCMGWVLVPESGLGRDGQVTPTSHVATAMRKDVPTAQVRTLIVDGCDQALALKDANGIRVVVSEDFPRQESHLSAFSKFFAPHVSPPCLNQVPGKMQDAVAVTRVDMNQAKIHSAFEDVNIAGRRYTGADAYQNPSCDKIATEPKLYP